MSVMGPPCDVVQGRWQGIRRGRGNFRQPLGCGTAFRADHRAMTDAALQLHPDRLLPADPTTRGIARRLYAAVRDLPIISPHGHVPPEWIAEDVPFGDPTSLLISPDHYVTRLLHANGVRAGEPRRRRHAAHGRRVPGGLAGAVHPLGRLPRDAEPVLVGERARRDLRGDRAPVRGHRRHDLRPGRRNAAPARLPAPRAAGPLRHRGAGHHRRPGRRPGPPRGHPRRPEQSRPGCCPRSVPTATWSPAGPTGRSWSTRSAPRPTPTPATTRASSPRWRTGAATSSRTAPSPPTTATPTPAPPRSTRPTPNGSSGRPARARRPRTRPPRCAGTCCWRWPGCRSRTVW